MSVPDPPTIRKRPKGSDHTLEFWWQTADVSGYILRCATPPQEDRLYGPQGGYAYVTDLSNAVSYSFELVATDSSGESDPSPFRVAQPGVLAGVPTSVVFTPDPSGTLVVTWDEPEPNPNASAIGWYIIKLFFEGALVYAQGTHGYDRMKVVKGLDTNKTYTCVLQPINSAGYGPAVTGSVNFDSQAGLTLWLDAANLSSLYQDVSGLVPVTDDGQNVLLWKDRSGKGHNFASPTQTTWPYYSISDNTSLIVFNATRLTSSFALAPSNTMTMFAVFLIINNDETTEINPSIFRSDTSGNNLALTAVRKEGVISNISYTNGTFGLPPPEIDCPPPYIRTLFVAYNDASSNSVRYTAYPPTISRSFVQVTQNPLDILSSYVLGSDLSANNNLLMFELQIYDSVLTDLSRAEVTAGLCEKWPFLASAIFSEGHIGTIISCPNFVPIVDGSGLIDGSGFTFNMFGVNRASSIRWHDCNVLSFGPGSPDVSGIWNAAAGVGILCGNSQRSVIYLGEKLETIGTYNVLAMLIAFSDISGGDDNGQMNIRLIKETVTGKQFIEFRVTRGRGVVGAIETPGTWNLTNGTSFQNTFGGDFTDVFPADNTSFTLQGDASGSVWTYLYQTYLFTDGIVNNADNGVAVNITTSGALLVNNNITFTADISGTYQYVTGTWNANGIKTYNTSSPLVVSFDTSGEYFVSYTIETKNDIYSNTISVNIVNASLPQITDITSTVPIEVGIPATFTAEISGAYIDISDAWSVDGIDISNNVGNIFTYTFNTSGIYEVAYHLLTSVGEVDLSKNFTVIDVVTINYIISSVDPPVLNEPTIFTVDICGAYTYVSDKWFIDGVDISDNTNGIFNYTFTDGSGLHEIAYELTTSADLSSSYVQTFYVVGVSGDPIELNSSYGAVQNFRVPAGYTLATVAMLGGSGGGGGGGGDSGSGDRGGGGGGGGGGADISGSFSVAVSSILNINGGAGGASGGGGDGGDGFPYATNGDPGSAGGATELFISYNTQNYYLRSGGGGSGGGGGAPGGSGGDPRGGDGGTADISGISPENLTLLPGSAGGDGMDGGDGGLGGEGGARGGGGPGGAGGTVDVPQGNPGSIGDGGGGGGSGGSTAGGGGGAVGLAGSFMLTLTVPAPPPLLPQILNISSTPAVPVAGQPTFFLGPSDTSGYIPFGTVYTWSLNGSDGGAMTDFTPTLEASGEILVGLTLTLGDISESYAQTFYVVGVSGDPLVLSSASGAVQNFRVPAGYTSMNVNMLGGGGGGGGGGGAGLDDGSGNQLGGGGGGGGGGGVDISGTCDISANIIISVDISGVGYGGAGGAYGGFAVGGNGDDGSWGQVITMFINNSVSIVAGGGGSGGGGAGATPNASGGGLGVGGSESVILSGLLSQNGAAGSNGGDNNASDNGGLGGGNGGRGGNGAYPFTTNDGSGGTIGGSANFVITFTLPLAPIIESFNLGGVLETSFDIGYVISGTVTHLEFYINGGIVIPDNFDTMSALFTGLTRGESIEIYMIAYNGTSFSTSSTLTFSMDPGPAPTISTLTLDAVGETTFTISYTVTDTASLTFYVNGNETSPDASGFSSATFSGYSAGQYMEVSVRANGYGGQTAESTSRNFYMKPDPPTSLAVVSQTSTTLDITWQAPSATISGYNLRYTPLEATTQPIVLLDYAISYTIESLTPDTIYDISLTSINLDSIESTPAITDGTTESTPPTPPTITSFDLSGKDTTQFVIAYTITGTFDTINYYINSSPASPSSATGSYAQFIERAPGEPIAIYMEVFNGASSSISSTLTFDMESGATVTDLSATNITANSFTVTYSSQNATSFTYYNDDGSSTNIIIPDVSGTGFADFTGVSSGTPFAMYIIAHGPGGDSAIPDIKLIFNTLLDTPTGLTATDISQTTLTLTWGDVSGAADYTLDVSGGGGMPSWTTVSNLGTYISSLTAYTEYTFIVTATNYGNSTYSAPASITVTTLPDLPARPTAMSSAFMTAYTATITWDDPADPSLTGFKVYYSTTATLDNGVAVSPFDLSYTFTGLDLLTPYYFNVKFVNVTGDSGPVDPSIQGTTSAPPPIQYSPLGPTLPSTVPAGYNTLDYVLLGGGAGGNDGANAGDIGGNGGNGGGNGSMDAGTLTVNSGDTLSIMVATTAGSNDPGNDTVLTINGTDYTASGGSAGDGYAGVPAVDLSGGQGGAGVDGIEITDLIETTTYKYGEGGGGGGGGTAGGTEGTGGPAGAGAGGGTAGFGGSETDGGGGGNGGAGFYLVKLSYSQ